MPRLASPIHHAISSAQRVKCVIIGDIDVGKTSLLITYVCNRFPVDYVPEVFSESYQECYDIDGHIASLELWDAGIDDDRIRPIAYLAANVFIIAFSIGSPKSYESVRTLWAPEIASFGPSTAGVLLLGTKSDLRHKRSSEAMEGVYNRRMPPPISYQQGEALARDIGALGYLECSALTPIGLSQVFDETVRIGLSHPTKEQYGVLLSKLKHPMLKHQRRASASGCIIV